MWKETVSVSPPYHFDRVLERLSLDPLHAVDLEKREVKLPLRNEEKQPCIITVQATGTVDHPEFLVSGHGEQKAMLKEVNRIFRWEESLQPVMDHFSKTSLSVLFKEHRGTPIVLDFQLYHCLMKCIIHQQLNLAFAYRLTERFVHTFGEQQDGIWFYPLPETIAKLDYNDLRELQFSMRKSEYVIDTSRMIAAGELNLDEFPLLSDEEIMGKLVKIRGIGPWTVQNVLLFGLGRPNLFPLADIGIQRAIKHHFGLQTKPSKEDMLTLSKEWQPYLSYASMYLWRSIE
ncbi:DNA-3-methyladenine glycosylase [Bacillus sp. CLL-7-23]|uniref:DNA-3-methyladenine glycosylase II n=1 Tax=Bacillus changyiensis TaxID=3004103 RepID=A0ABT4X332_9BACI|nr:DNA-3-methyladenine glycosylase [Bacillus changyiensis]MDA7026685.1 DNA-3-methyladenine glycosylase [Bacillus changyiensis]